ncbi:MAG: HD domain-containing protein [Spirochaetes bacterium]|nr:HD domain-containing protein [Spirochaetota bacterium]
MNKYIIISNSIKNNITLPEKISKNIILSKNISSTIRNILKTNTTSKTSYAVIFIHINELQNISEILTGKYNYNELMYKIIVAGEEKDLKLIRKNRLQHISDIKTSRISSQEFDLLVEKAFLHIDRFNKYKTQINNSIYTLQDMKQDQEDLINIGKSLSTIKDPDELLKNILMISKKITCADAGSIYITEENEAGKKYLRFKYSHTFNRKLPMEEFTLSINKNSIAGYVATKGEVLNIPDAYNIPKKAPYSFDISFDRRTNYICRSMLVVPMRNHIDQIIGVIQLINSKQSSGCRIKNGSEAFGIKLKTPEDFNRLVVPFDSRYESLMESVAGQAAIAIENNRMIKQIQNQFEEFIKASVTAVESRDIATSGHSFRVAEICKEMARAISGKKSGRFKDIKYSDTEIKELEFAALLHDFGKVYIDINIFKKEKKLYQKEFENLILKFNYLYKFIELGYTFQQTGQAEKKITKVIADLEHKKEEKLKKIIRIKDRITLLNEPSITEKDPRQILSQIQKEIKGIKLFDIDGNRINLITKNERRNLEIKRGSLNSIERKEIHNHVVLSYNFVSKIPWPPEYKNIPAIVLYHHEMLDGSGYPKGIRGDKIPVQARIMAIADIYDALIAADRPYKKAIDHSTALKILKEEAENNRIDKDLLEIFIKQKIYKIIDKNTFKIKFIGNGKPINN